MRRSVITVHCLEHRTQLANGNRGQDVGLRTVRGISHLQRATPLWHSRQRQDHFDDDGVP